MARGTPSRCPGEEDPGPDQELPCRRVVPTDAVESLQDSTIPTMPSGVTKTASLPITDARIVPSRVKSSWSVVPHGSRTSGAELCVMAPTGGHRDPVGGVPNRQLGSLETARLRVRELMKLGVECAWSAGVTAEVGPQGHQLTIGESGLGPALAQSLRHARDRVGAAGGRGSDDVRHGASFSG